MWVVKLGGSLLGSPELEGWLELIHRLGDGKVIIVPGGGVFADAVRASQQLSGVDDKTAHQLAVMAMDQYGVLMTGLNPKIVTAASELELAERGWQHRGIVWLPSKMVCADDEIPCHWDVTSDSLAAWLAHKINATHLVLVKSTQPEGQVTSAKSMAENGMVDDCLPQFISNAEYKTWIIDKTKYKVFAEAISSDLLEKHALLLECAAENRVSIAC